MINGFIEDLVFISNIPMNCKPNFSDKSYTSKDEWFSTIKRRYKSEKGEKGVIYVDNLLNRIEKAGVPKEIRHLLAATEEGFMNLINTYNLDQQQNVALGYLSCWNRVKKWLENNQPKKFFNCSPIICVSEHSQEDNK
jgi:hypothetical protein